MGILFLYKYTHCIIIYKTLYLQCTYANVQQHIHTINVCDNRIQIFNVHTMYAVCIFSIFLGQAMYVRPPTLRVFLPPWIDQSKGDVLGLKYFQKHVV